jgi:hypothetical protein
MALIDSINQPKLVHVLSQVIEASRRFCISFISPDARQISEEDHFISNIERLAQTSPHLLDDIGLRDCGEGVQPADVDAASLKAR